MWSLYERALTRFGPVATLIEWDTDIPDFAVLQREAATAQAYLEACLAIAACELQTQFATAMLADTATRERIAIYRNRCSPIIAMRSERPTGSSCNWSAGRSSMRRGCLCGEIPSTGGDLNVYGDRFGDFLASYPPAKALPYLPDVARLEWAVDESHRAADHDGTPAQVLAGLAAIPGNEVALQRFALDPSCRFVASDYPVLRIWQVNQPGFGGDGKVEFGIGSDWLLVRREAGAVVIERLAPAEFAWLQSLAARADLATALERAVAAESTFDLGTVLRACIANGTIRPRRRVKSIAVRDD